MRKIYIDLGCFDGDSIHEFFNWGQLRFDNLENWQIYGFDPNPHKPKLWDDLMFHKPNVKLEARAALTYNGEVEFTRRPYEQAQGSTVMKQKRDWGLGDVFKVPCFDFSEFLNRLEKREDDWLMVKIDIEGAEYDLLEHLIKQKTLSLIDILMVEWHWPKLDKPDDFKARQDKIIQEINNQVSEFYDWS